MTKAQIIEAILATMDNDMKQRYEFWLKRQTKEMLEDILARRTNKEVKK